MSHLRLAGILLFAVIAFGCSRPAPEGGAAAGGYERGPHRGRWLADGAFALEVTIFEQGIPPEFRVFPFREGRPADPNDIELEVTLNRLGGRVERIAFAATGEYLRATGPVEEPHSFDTEWLARESGREHRFTYSSYENRVTLEPAQIAAAGITVREAGPATISERTVLNGRIAANEDAHAHVVARFPGVARSVHKRLGESVVRGELLAVIESNESLHEFEVRAPLAGTIVEKQVSPGEFVSSDRPLYEIVDLATVWVDLDVYRRDFARLRVGQRVWIDAGDGSPVAESTLAYLSPVGSSNTQTLLARVVLPNAERSWRPGLFVTGSVEVDSAEVPVAVTADALQRLRDWNVVFIGAGKVFEAQPIELGRRDASHVEVVSGLAAGQSYVAAGSFVLKADAGKAGATHDH